MHWLPKSEEHKHHAAICCQNTAEDPCKDTDVTLLGDAGNNHKPKAERYGGFSISMCLKNISPKVPRVGVEPSENVLEAIEGRPN